MCPVELSLLVVKEPFTVALSQNGRETESNTAPDGIVIVEYAPYPQTLQYPAGTVFDPSEFQLKVPSQPSSLITHSEEEQTQTASVSTVD